MELLITFFTKLNNFNQLLFYKPDMMLDKLPIQEWLADAIKDGLHMLPFLFFIFIVIEIIEYFYSDKMTQLSKYSGKTGPFAGSLLASFPQCGFSVIASTLYSKRFITKGTLLAVYLATSDEAIPVIMAEPTKIHLIVPIILTKIIIAIVAGYFIDFIIEQIKKNDTPTIPSDDDSDEGCCRHLINKADKADLFLHPIKHTFNVFVFVLLVTIAINYMVFRVGGEENRGQYFLNNSIFQPVITAFIGLIPNCAVSIAITLMYLKGAIGFGSVISGLCSGAGLGLLILLKKNAPLKDTLRIILILLTVSIFSGILIQTVYN